MEEWRNVDGFNNYYCVSSAGRVVSFVQRESGKLLKPRDSGKGYLTAVLFMGDGLNTRRNFPVHRLVALTFIPNPGNKPAVNHKDGNKGNNSVDNLEWVTNKENIRHAYDTGLHPALTRSKNFSTEYNRSAAKAKRKLTDVDVASIKSDSRTLSEISKQYGVGISTIHRVINNHSYKDVK